MEQSDNVLTSVLRYYRFVRFALKNFNAISVYFSVNFHNDLFFSYFGATAFVRMSTLSNSKNYDDKFWIYIYLY